MDVRVVLVTTPDADAAERLVGTLVGEGLAACGNVVPSIVSIFRWEGAVQRESEALILLKTSAGRVEQLRRRVVELHPYDVPEVIALPVAEGHGPYLDWVLQESGGGADGA